MSYRVKIKKRKMITNIHPGHQRIRVNCFPAFSKGKIHGKINRQPDGIIDPVKAGIHIDCIIEYGTASHAVLIPAGIIVIGMANMIKVDRWKIFHQRPFVDLFENKLSNVRAGIPGKRKKDFSCVDIDEIPVNTYQSMR